MNWHMYMMLTLQAKIQSVPRCTSPLFHESLPFLLISISQNTMSTLANQLFLMFLLLVHYLFIVAFNIILEVLICVNFYLIKKEKRAMRSAVIVTCLFTFMISLSVGYILSFEYQLPSGTFQSIQGIVYNFSSGAVVLSRKSPFLNSNFLIVGP